MEVTDRFETPLYSMGEAAQYLGVPESTFHTWAKGYRRCFADGREVRGAPFVTALPARRRGEAVIPFVGLGEGLVAAAFRRAGVPLQRIRPAVERLQRELGLDHALASRALYTDGAEVLYDFAQQQGDSPEARSARQLVVVRNNQRVFNEIVDDYLQRVEFAADGYPQIIHLPSYTVADVVADPRRGFGQPTFVRGGARVEDALSLFRAGERMATVAAEYGVPIDQLEDAVRVATTRLAA
ncbi:MAG: hypothetical protein ACOYBY_00930 [Dermatophilaceae bacterium]